MKKFKVIYVPTGKYQTETILVDSESKPNVLRVFNLGSVVSIVEEVSEAEL